jgi:hypothetical protein
MRGLNGDGKSAMAIKGRRKGMNARKELELKNKIELEQILFLEGQNYLEPAIFEGIKKKEENGRLATKNWVFPKGEWGTFEHFCCLFGMQNS